MPEKTVLLVEDEDNIALALEHLIGRASAGGHGQCSPGGNGRGPA